MSGPLRFWVAGSLIISAYRKMAENAELVFNDTSRRKKNIRGFIPNHTLCLHRIFGCHSLFLLSSLHISTAWCLRNDGVNSVLLGASSTDQLMENIRAIQVRMFAVSQCSFTTTANTKQSQVNIWITSLYIAL